MDLTTLLLALVVFTLAFVLSSTLDTRRRNLPPGPYGLPFFGHILMFLKTDKVFEKLAEMAKEYGKVMRVSKGMYDVIVLNGYDVMKEAMIDKADIFSERPRWMKDIQELQRHKSGIFFHEGWHERRRFTLVSMRDFGLGKRSLEDKMVEEAAYLNEEFTKYEGKPFDPSKILPFTTSNIICSLINGKRFEYGDPDFVYLNECLGKFLTRGTNIDYLVPFLKFFRAKEGRFQAGMKSFQPLIAICNEWMTEHSESFDANSMRDIIDLFLAENRKGGAKVADRDLAMLIFELFLAGTETTSTTLCWALLYLIHNQTIQDKCRDEIKETIGMNRAPVYSDNKNTPYLNAFIYETQRFGNIVPMSISHCAAVDAELDGYTIPAGSVVVMNMQTALRDPKYWTDPDTFNPDRWLDKDGAIIKNPAFIPFSIGKRTCLGEQLARKELYIFLTSMLQKFKFSMVDEHNPPRLEGTGSTIHRPQHYMLMAVKI